MSRHLNTMHNPNICHDTSESALVDEKLTIFLPDGHMRSIQALEADIIRMAVRHYGGQMSEVARRLGIGRSTLYRKLNELKIELYP